MSTSSSSWSHDPTVRTSGNHHLPRVPQRHRVCHHPRRMGYSPSTPAARTPSTRAPRSLRPRPYRSRAVAFGLPSVARDHVQDREGRHLMSNRKPRTYILYFTWNGLPVYSNNHCFYCGVWIWSKKVITRGASNRRTKDHLTPLAREGPDIIRNMKWCCYRCNHEKGIMTLAEYRLSKGPHHLFWGERLYMFPETLI